MITLVIFSVILTVTGIILGFKMKSENRNADSHSKKKQNAYNQYN